MKTTVTWLIFVRSIPGTDRKTDGANGKGSVFNVCVPAASPTKRWLVVQGRLLSEGAAALVVAMGAWVVGDAGLCTGALQDPEPWW